MKYGPLLFLYFFPSMLSSFCSHCMAAFVDFKKLAKLPFLLPNYLVLCIGGVWMRIYEVFS